jgi:cytochrome c-type biogenesis protein CcmH/NrfF
MDLFDRRRFARVAYLGLFVALYYGTDLFVQYEALLWLAILGILVVFFDAVICARRRWRVVKSELSDDSEEEAEPNC